MRRTCLIVVCLLAAAGAARATSYVMMDDESLYEQAPAIAQVSVLSVGPAPAAGVPATDYIVVVERLLKGQIAGSTVVVRVAGGVGPDGWGLQVVGAPSFAEGDRAILFLVPRHDGTYGILHLMLGAFHEFTIGDHHLALRDLYESQAVGTGTADSRTAWPRSFEAFADWLAGGAGAATDYRVPVSEARLETWREAFALLRYQRRRLRWFDGHVEWLLGRSAPTGSRRLLKEALRAWTPVAGLRLVYGGRSDADAGLDTFDGLNVVAFGDAEEILPGRFDCRRGGVVAVGAPWFDPEVTAKVRPGAGSAASIRILGADIVLNDGAECLFSGLDTLPRAMLLRELGHTLGLAYACGDSLDGPCDNSLERSPMTAVSGPEALPMPGRRDGAALHDVD
jgi:hypothetical protein